MSQTPTATNMKLSILEGVGLYNGESAEQALQHATEAAQQADRLGFTRLWFTEHHGSKHKMSTSPDLLVAHARR